MKFELIAETLTTIEGMDSREIASQTEKRHDNVCRDILAMLSELNIDHLKFEGVYRGGNGEPRRCFVLPKRECLILASGYNVVLRAKIIDRWAELEAGQPKPKDLSRLEILRMALEAEEKVEALKLQVEAQAPAVAFVDRYVEAKGEKGVREVAKMLGIGPKKFVEWLLTEKVMFRENGKLLPTQCHIDKGRFEVKTGVVGLKGKKTEIAFSQAQFTPKGVAWIAEKTLKTRK